MMEQLVSSSMQKRQSTPVNAFNFDKEELHWPEVKEDLDPEKLINQDGMYKFSKVKKLLGLESIELTKLSRLAQGKGINTYEEYGFGKPYGSQYILKMSRFRKTYRMLKKGKEQPTNVDLTEICTLNPRIKNANQLIKQPGIYRLSAVCRFQPFSEVEVAIKKHIRMLKDQAKAMDELGCWYDESKREFFVDMEPFSNWFFSEVWMK